MNRLTVLAAILGAGLTASAQHLNTMNPVRPMPAPVNALPYGNILYPGGIHHTQRVGGLITGSMPYTGVPPQGSYGYPGPGVIGGRPGGAWGGRNRTMVVPYAVPVFAGGYGYADYGYAAQPNVTLVVPQQPTPSVVINQHYTPPEAPKPVIRDYSDVDLPQPSVKVYEGPKTQVEPSPAVARQERDDRPTIYLIALKDTSIRQAIGYWVEGNTLHYVTPKSAINHVTLDMVDKEMSEQLNSERRLDFDLNAAKRR